MLCYFHIFLLFMKITKNNLCLSVSRLFLSVWGRGSIKICMSLHAHRFDCERACVRPRARARVCVCVLEGGEGEEGGGGIRC